MSRAQLDALERIGGAVCLDFTNTVDPRHRTADRIDYLADYQALLSWSLLVGLLDRGTEARLNERARRHRAEAKRVLERALALREAIYELLGRPGTRNRMPALAVLNAEHERASSRRTVVASAGSFRRSWVADDELDRMLWPLAECAVELMTSPLLARIRECEGDECGWLFLDTSKAGRRRWCSMSDCGNRAKAKRRRRSESAAALTA